MKNAFYSAGTGFGLKSMLPLPHGRRGHILRLEMNTQREGNVCYSRMRRLQPKGLAGPQWAPHQLLPQVLHVSRESQHSPAAGGQNRAGRWLRGKVGSCSTTGTSELLVAPSSCKSRRIPAHRRPATKFPFFFLQPLFHNNSENLSKHPALNLVTAYRA